MRIAFSPGEARPSERVCELYDVPSFGSANGFADEWGRAALGAYDLYGQDSEIGLGGADATLTEADHRLIAYQQIPQLVTLAYEASSHGSSYRSFLVGAAAYVVNNARTRLGYLTGANLKPNPLTQKRCAEMEILQKVLAGNFGFVVALAVFGPPDNGEINGSPSRTLHPCAPCRQLLNTNPGVRSDTLLITATDNYTEVMLMGELDKLYPLTPLLQHTPLH